MKFLNKYNKFFESSQSKKIRKYVGYSVVLEWYRVNKEKIAKILNCDVSDLADEDTLMHQSYDLINTVINPQARGNSGIDNTDIPGFKDFKRIENNLIHDILHNIYNVKAKNFDKSLSNIEFTESEIIEEIECLAIEESFMKYMNIQYLKTDFINANINQLASYLMMAIIKNDPDRIKRILDDEVEPYLEVYGKKYTVKGTPFEKFFDLFRNTDADSNFRIKNSNDFKEYMIRLINVGQGISDSGGDRANYPDGVFGDMEFSDLEDDDIKWRIEHHFEDNHQYILINKEDNDLDKFKFDYAIIGYGKRLAYSIELDEDTKKQIDFKLKIMLRDLNFDLENYTKKTGDISMQIFPNNVNYDDESVEASYWNKKTNKTHSGNIKIDNLPLYFQKELQLENVNIKYNIENFKDQSNLTAIPIKLEFIDRKTRTVDMDKWFDFLEDKYTGVVYTIDEKKYIGLSYTYDENEEGEKVKIYNIMDADDFIGVITDDYYNGDRETYSNNHEFIDFESYRKMSFEEIVHDLFNDDDSISILRRNFRLGDIIKNNTKIGNINSFATDRNVNTKEIETKNPKHTYLDFAGYTDINISLSKVILTDNGKKLRELLDNFRGYIISNFEKLKNKSKSNAAKFTSNDIKTFREIKYNDLKLIEDFNDNELSITFEVYYQHTKSLSISYNTPPIYKTLYKFYSNFENMKQFSKLIENESDIEYLKNFVNLSGNIKTTKDYFNFKKMISSIAKKDIFKWKQPIVEIYSTDIDIAPSSEILSNIKQTIEANTDKNDKYTIDINNQIFNKKLTFLLSNMIKTYYPKLKISELKLIKCSSYATSFEVIIK